ncbi:hypothetical protein GPECTOR_1g303 [Gonium pectorale]|uniref:Uncharacterized protein n=1 Tax=Gonium pectorale TaxID=33097 RepID=A0A150H2W4_GONPE|nr:hypothetical protein GPECTOR_1g303 [Gonium pectorale]|eukprot:KXZ56343.1 hypothetical protein GPECTOR_1g303 [Gonium pectorale]
MMGEEGVEGVVTVREGGEVAIEENREQQSEEHSDAQLPAAEVGPSPKEVLTEMTRCVLHHALMVPWICGMPPAHVAATAVILVCEAAD